jgi:nucleotidyltransferase/DNA polymerase involved in DNA repair
MASALGRRRVIELRSVGPATAKDLALLGITTVAQLAEREAGELYARLCEITGQRHDPCCEDVFAAAIAQARDPALPREQSDWAYWSRLRKARTATY